jgi:3-hydroxyacyl-CoA dehydrogenase
MKAEGLEPAAWVTEMLAAGNKSFYTVTDGATHNIPSKAQTKFGSR